MSFIPQRENLAGHHCLLFYFLGGSGLGSVVMNKAEEIVNENGSLISEAAAENRNNPGVNDDGKPLNNKKILEGWELSAAQTAFIESLLPDDDSGC